MMENDKKDKKCMEHTETNYLDNMQNIHQLDRLGSDIQIDIY